MFKKLFKTKADKILAEKESKILFLNNWINNITREITKACIEQSDTPRLRKDLNKNFGCHVELDNLTRADFQSLKGSLEKLFEVCKNQDIFIGVENFDLLPRTAVPAPGGGYSRQLNTDKQTGPRIIIRAKDVYPYSINPYKKDDSQFKLSN